jgi:hypothetical protein
MTLQPSCGRALPLLPTPPLNLGGLGYRFFLAAVRLAVAFRAAGLRAAGLRAVAFFAVGLRAVALRAAGLRAVAFFAAGLRAGAFLAVARFFGLAAAFLVAFFAAGFGVESLDALPGLATTSLKTLPALKVGTFLEGICITFLVRGLIPLRAARFLDAHVPKPGILTVSPLATAAIIELTKAVTALFA